MTRIRWASLALVIPLLLAAPATAEAKAKPRAFTNCTAVHVVYKGGIARVGAKDKRSSGHAKFKPYVSTALYLANKKMDRDRDGIACEQ